MKLIAVLTTTESGEEAKSIAAHLVEHKLAACVQIEKIQSVYTWDGATQDSAEFRLLIKTLEDRYRDVEAAILELHSYELPAIYAVPLEHAHEPYAEWVAANSQKADENRKPGNT